MCDWAREPRREREEMGKSLRALKISFKNSGDFPVPRRPAASSNCIDNQPFMFEEKLLDPTVTVRCPRIS